MNMFFMSNWQVVLTSHRQNFQENLSTDQRQFKQFFQDYLPKILTFRLKLWCNATYLVSVGK